MTNKQKCINCSKVPDDVLVLSCNHCICLHCASKQVKQVKHQYLVECRKCGEMTELEEDLYNHLMSLMKPRNRKKQQNILNQHIVIRQDRQPQLNDSSQQLQRTCDAHQEYAIMYVCKTCNDTFICPECIVNGNHKNHVAIVIQKQGEKIKNKLQLQLSKVDEKIQGLQKMEVKRLSKIGERKSQLLKLKNIAVRQYEQIKQAIAKEEHTIISKCNQLIAGHQKQEESLKLQVSQQIQLFEDQRIQIIDLLNPLLQESIMGESRAIHKMLMVNLVESYKQFMKDSQRNRQNYIKIAEQRMEEDMQVIHSLTQKIDRICINQFQPHKKQLQGLDNKIKYRYPNSKGALQQVISNKKVPVKHQYNSNKDDFFRLL